MKENFNDNFCYQNNGRILSPKIKQMDDLTNQWIQSQSMASTYINTREAVSKLMPESSFDYTAANMSYESSPISSYITTKEILSRAIPKSSIEHNIAAARIQYISLPTPPHINIKETLSKLISKSSFGYTAAKMPYESLPNHISSSQINDQLINVDKKIRQMHNYNSEISNKISQKNMLIGIKTNNLMNNISSLTTDRILNTLNNDIHSSKDDIDNQVDKHKTDNKESINYNEDIQISDYLGLQKDYYSKTLKEDYYKIKEYYNNNLSKPVKIVGSFIISNIINQLLGKICEAFIHYGYSLVITIINYLIQLFCS